MTLFPSHLYQHLLSLVFVFLVSLVLYPIPFWCHSQQFSSGLGSILEENPSGAGFRGSCIHLPLEQVKSFTVWAAVPKLTHCTSWWIPGGYFIVLFLDTLLLPIAFSCIVANSIQVLWWFWIAPTHLYFWLHGDILFSNYSKYFLWVLGFPISFLCFYMGIWKASESMPTTTIIFEIPITFIFISISL